MNEKKGARFKWTITSDVINSLKVWDKQRGLIFHL